MKKVKVYIFFWVRWFSCVCVCLLGLFRCAAHAFRGDVGVVPSLPVAHQHINMRVCGVVRQSRICYTISMLSVCAATYNSESDDHDDDDENDVAYELIALLRVFVCVCVYIWILFRRNRITGSYFACVYVCVCNSQIHDTNSEISETTPKSYALSPTFRT